MRNPKYTLMAAGAFAVLVAAVSVGSELVAKGQKGGPPVFDTLVVNPITQPVPVTLQGAAQIASDNPLPVRVVESPDSAEYIATADQVVPDGSKGIFQGLMEGPAIPAGKHLVIDYVNFSVENDRDQPVFVSIDTTIGGEPRKQSMPMAQPPSTFALDKYRKFASETVKIPHYGNNPPRFTCLRNSVADLMTVHVTVVGHLVNE